MNSNIDDWLDSLGLPIGEEAAPAQAAVPTETSPETQLAVNEVPSPIEEPQQNISMEDFNEILAESGFEDYDYAEAEEVTDDETPDGREEGNDTYHPEEDNMAEDTGSEENSYDENQGEGTDPIVEEETDTGNPTHVAGSPSAGTYTPLTADSQINEAMIPPNSPTLLMDDSTSRFSGAEWYRAIQRKRIILAGCGGIGSWCILQLARMNPATLFLYDDDIVETANMSGQLYCREDVGKAKVNAMADMISSYTTMRNVYALRERFTDSTEAGDVMICGFDNMTARKVFFSKWLEHVMSLPEEERGRCLLLDGRLSIDTLQVLCITGDNSWAVREYRDRYLFNDSDADATVCSMKQTTYLACMIGSVIVNLFTNWTANQLNPVIPYDLPFFTEYDAKNMIFKTIK